MEGATLDSRALELLELFELSRGKDELIERDLTPLEPSWIANRPLRDTFRVGGACFSILGADARDGVTAVAD